MVKEYHEEKLASVVSITHVGDSEYREEGLQVEKKSDFRILALGEGKSGKMYDYIWFEIGIYSS